MSELLTLQDLANGHLDVKALGEAANGDENTIVTTRTGNTYPSAERAINIMFKNGGLPAEPFETFAKMETDGTILPDGQLAMVYNDPVLVDNGLYVKGGQSFERVNYNTENVIDAKLGSVINIKNSKNLYIESRKVAGQYVDKSGKILRVEGWSRSDFIPATEGETYTVSAVARRLGLAFYSSKSTAFDAYIDGSYNGASGTVTATAPVGANYLVINVDSTTVTADKVQVEIGSTATEYEVGKLLYTIKDDALPEGLVIPSDLVELEDRLKELKDYELIRKSKNLFDERKKVQFSFLSSSSGNILTAEHLNNWYISNHIPVTSGETYTLSGSRGQRGVAFFANDGDTTAISYIDSVDMPLTFTVPSGANYVVFSLQSESAPYYSNIMLEKGDTATNYTYYGDELLVNADKIAKNDAVEPQSVFTSNGDLTATISAKKDINVSLQLQLGRPVTLDKSSAFNFMADYINGKKVREPTDDVAPIRAWGATVGANHGYFKVTLTVSSHGKTASDVGSVWSDGSKQWVVIAINDSNKITVTARNDNSTSIGSSLTHVSGAVNTEAMSISGNSSSQWYPVFKDHSINVFVDDVAVDKSKPLATEYKKNVAVYESYKIMSKEDMTNHVITNKGKQLSSYDAEPSILVNVCHVFDASANCTVYVSLTALKDVDFMDYMGTQAICLTDTQGRYFYVPKATPYEADGITYDFANKQPMTEPLAWPAYLNEAKTESGVNPLDRVLQANNVVGFAVGFLPLYDAEPSARRTNASVKYFEIRAGSTKTYPMLIDKGRGNIVAGTTYSGVAYRNYYKISDKRTAKYVVHHTDADYLYLDWHTAGVDIIELEADLVGRSFTVHEQSDNVTLLSKYATNNIVVKVDSSKNYGYLVLRFDK